jgi:hypothetical protein
VPILHIGFPDDIFQLKRYKKIDQIAADSPHLGKNKADNFHLSMHAKSKHKIIQFIQALFFSIGLKMKLGRHCEQGYKYLKNLNPALREVLENSLRYSHQNKPDHQSLPLRTGLSLAFA